MVSKIYLIYFTVLALAANSFNLWSLWVWMELLNFIFIPSMAFNSLTYRKKILFYFIIQSCVSFILIISIFLMNFHLFVDLLIISCLLFKLGSFPFFSWVLKVVEDTDWSFIKYLFTVMKGVPFIMLTYIKPYEELIWLSVIGMMISLGGVYSSSMRKIMAFSSIDHTSWMIISLMLAKWTFVMYFLMYTLMLSIVTQIFNKVNLTSLKNFTFSQFMKVPLFMTFITITSLPPFIMFLPKIFLVKMMIDQGYLIVAVVSTTISICSVYMYIKVFILGVMYNKISLRPFMSYVNSKSLMFYMLIIFSMYISYFLIYMYW
uniref:NADH dehydrogenase subunit 2 n=1 Tax=Menacanthus cornutus TaxID=1491751 RepID=UPI0020015B28|nr:NADH dehydrogenase subunit 2 [Menacanthus cornutus]UNZ13001.1 NADH dehydrogenase subunit 2 [Menacanthus cornutus]